MKKETIRLYLAWLVLFAFMAISYSYPAKLDAFFLSYTHDLPSRFIFYSYFFVHLLAVVAASYLGYSYAQALYLKSNLLAKIPNWVFALPLALVSLYLLSTISLVHNQTILHSFYRGFYYLRLSPCLLIFFTSLAHHLKKMTLKGDA